MNIMSNCMKCGSEKLRAEYHIANRNTHYVYRHLVCVECGAPSQLENLFDCEEDRQEYYISYHKGFDMDVSFEQFAGKIINYIKGKITETILKDERENLIKGWRGYVSLEELYSFLKW
ncbi:MAG: hypothetical protein NC489_26910 [Ruminococcus flavefaciens]|nr:hypothetical protein [Ruminococcus flavefaciens]